MSVTTFGGALDATGSTGRSSARPVVASVPSGHVYVRHLAPLGNDGATRLEDPPPAGRAATSQQWWPPTMLEPAWVEHADFDLMHLHFGFDARSPESLAELVATLRRRGRPLVYTVHDLRNPHHLDRAAHDEQLDVLVPAADELITLTAGAADEIRRRWGRHAVVLPHPHVVALGDVGRWRRSPRRPDDAPFRVGLHLKSLRPAMDPAPLLPVLTEIVAALPGAVFQVDVHRDVMAGTSPRPDPALVRTLEDLDAAGRIELHVHDYFTDQQLWDYLGGLDVSVLPYRFGTHSGWLEACRDLGTTVVAPTCGYYSEQGPVLTYRHDEAGFGPETLATAVRHAYDERPDLGSHEEERLRDRRRLAAGHDLVYRAALG